MHGEIIPGEPVIYHLKNFNAAGVPSQVSCVKIPVNDLLSSTGLECHMVTMQSHHSPDPMMQAVKE